MPPAQSGIVKYPAVLLLGPTGSGKTPLGELLEQRGLRGARCLHFDFGANLRRIVGHGLSNGRFTRDELDFLKQVLQSGALLEDEHFPLAERILKSFLADRDADEQTLIILNGLPRHVGQAEAVGGVVEVKAVIRLHCPSGVVLRRIRSNAGGDRANREDDDPQAIRDKLRWFDRRTAPLVEYYRDRGLPIHSVEVTATMTPEEMCQILQT